MDVQRARFRPAAGPGAGLGEIRGGEVTRDNQRHWVMRSFLCTVAALCMQLSLRAQARPEVWTAPSGAAFVPFIGCQSEGQTALLEAPKGTRSNHCRSAQRPLRRSLITDPLLTLACLPQEAGIAWES